MPATSTKPIVKGPVDGNIFAIVGACHRALRKAEMGDKCDELSEKVLSSESYDAALRVCMDYVEFDL